MASTQRIVPKTDDPREVDARLVLGLDEVLDTKWMRIRLGLASHVRAPPRRSGLVARRVRAGRCSPVGARGAALECSGPNSARQRRAGMARRGEPSSATRSRA